MEVKKAYKIAGINEATAKQMIRRTVGQMLNSTAGRINYGPVRQMNKQLGIAVKPLPLPNPSNDRMVCRTDKATENHKDEFIFNNRNKFNDRGNRGSVGRTADEQQTYYRWTINAQQTDNKRTTDGQQVYGRSINALKTYQHKQNEFNKFGLAYLSYYTFSLLQLGNLNTIS